MCLCICKGWQKGRLWEPFSASLPLTPTSAPVRFNPFLGPRRQACKVSLSPYGRHVFRHTPPSPPPTNFGSSSSVPKMDLSRSTLWVMAGGICRMLFPSGFRPPPLRLGVYSLLSTIHLSCHGGTIIAIPACLSPPTLDDFRFSREDVDGTGEISYS